MKQLIERAMQSGATATGYNLEAANLYLKAHADGRYKLFPLAATATWAYNQTGIVQYRGIKYYFTQTKDGFTLENWR
jgi:hypothetical protein